MADDSKNIPLMEILQRLCDLAKEDDEKIDLDSDTPDQK